MTPLTHVRYNNVPLAFQPAVCFKQMESGQDNIPLPAINTRLIEYLIKKGIELKVKEKRPKP